MNIYITVWRNWSLNSRGTHNFPYVRSEFRYVWSESTYVRSQKGGLLPQVYYCISCKNARHSIKSPVVIMVAVVLATAIPAPIEKP